MFSVNLSSRRVTLYRHDGKPVNDSMVYENNIDYDQAMERHIDRYVVEEDRAMMRESCSLPRIAAQLRQNETCRVHYRVSLGGEEHYYYRKFSRVGDAQSFENVVIGVACEDDEVLTRRRSEDLARSLSEVEYETMTGLYTREAFFVHAAQLLRQYPSLSFDFCVMKLESMTLLNHQYGRQAVDRLLRLIGRLLKTYDDDHTCLGYLGNGMFASYTENLPQDIRKKNVYGFRDRILAESGIRNASPRWAIYVDASRNDSIEDTLVKTEYTLNLLRPDLHEDYIEFDHSVVEINAQRANPEPPSESNESTISWVRGSAPPWMLKPIRSLSSYT